MEWRVLVLKSYFGDMMKYNPKSAAEYLKELKEHCEEIESLLPTLERIEPSKK
jgi:hypothetical protein